MQRRLINAIAVAHICDLWWVINYISGSDVYFDEFNFQHVKT